MTKTTSSWIPGSKPRRIHAWASTITVSLVAVDERGVVHRDTQCLTNPGYSPLFKVVDHHISGRLIDIGYTDGKLWWQAWGPSLGYIETGLSYPELGEDFKVLAAAAMGEERERSKVRFHKTRLRLANAVGLIRGIGHKIWGFATHILHHTIPFAWLIAKNRPFVKCPACRGAGGRMAGYEEPEWDECDLCYERWEDLVDRYCCGAEWVVGRCRIMDWARYKLAVWWGVDYRCSLLGIIKCRLGFHKWATYYSKTHCCRCSKFEEIDI